MPDLLLIDPGGPMPDIDIRRLPAARIEQVRSEQTRALYADAGFGVLSAFIGSGILAAVLLYLDAIPRERVAIWMTATLGSGLWQMAVIHQYRSRHPPPKEWRRWAHLRVWASGAEGLRWAIATIWLAAPGRLDEQLWIVLVVSNAAAASVSSIGAYLPAFYWLLFPAIVPFGFWSLAQGDVLHDALALLDIVFITAVALLARQANHHLVDELSLRFENADLAYDLGLQKARAEQANLEKSRFLAAASHDLRQPVHALSLFVGALHGMTVPPEARRLIGQIEASTSALDSLFTALLDISRLDAGTVEIHRRPFTIGSLIERLCQDHAEEARSKNLVLRCRRCDVAVDSDPMLMERILRNLIANAIRYTVKGKIVVGCRRRGDGVAVQVLDTGPGIAPDQWDKIFDEYYQVGNAERDRSKGLGLGLAIVRRLANLLGYRVILRSELGRGSCFEVVLPRAATRPDPEASNDNGAIAETGEKALIVVIDDERSVREAMFTLLTGWRYSVVVAGSGVEAVMQLSNVPICPSLLICDYRLRDGEDGIAVIERLRSEYNAEIPAMLITGDTAPDRMAEAKRSGLFLLYKPVSHGHLRAAIANLMALARDGSG